MIPPLGLLTKWIKHLKGTWASQVALMKVCCTHHKSVLSSTDKKIYKMGKNWHREKTFFNAPVRSWECFPAKKDGETPARRVVGQGHHSSARRVWFNFSGIKSAPSFVKGTTSSEADFSDSRSVTAKFGLMGTEVSGVAMDSPSPQRQMPKILKKSRYGS